MPDNRIRMNQGSTQTMERTGFESRGDGRSATPREPQQQERRQHAEGAIARTIEQQTAKLPSDVFLWSACACMGGSLLLHLMGQKHAGLFLGQWVAPMLLFGIYNKIVKVAGSDRATA